MPRNSMHWESFAHIYIQTHARGQAIDHYFILYAFSENVRSSKACFFRYLAWVAWSLSLSLSLENPRKCIPLKTAAE